MQSDDLRAALAQTEMPTRKHNGVLRIRVADNAFGLHVAFHRHCVVVNSEHVVHIKYRFVVEEGLLKCLELVFRFTFLFKRSVSVLDLLFGAAFVALREVGFNPNHDRVVIFLLGY